MSDHSTDNGATLAGYSEEYLADNGRGLDLHLLVQPGTDLDDTFTAFCTDEQEYIRVKGWLFTFTKLEA